MILANKEASYPHYFHALSPTEISAVKVTGDVEIGYIGFGSKGLHNYNYTQIFGIFSRSLWSQTCVSKKTTLYQGITIRGKQKPVSFLDLQPAPPVGFNLTFVCPEGEVETTQFVKSNQLARSRCSIMIGLQLRLS